MEKEVKKEIPDFSHTQRKQVPEEFTWQIKDIYPGTQAWENDKKILLEMTDKIDELAKDWTGSPQKMFQLLNHVSEIEKIEDRTYAYTSLLSDTDMGNSTWQAMKGEIHTASVNLRSKLAFMDPDIIKLGRKKISGYMKAEPRLKVYEMDFDMILRMKKHILPTDKERMMAETALFSGAPQKASKMLNDLDMPAPQITLVDGEKVKLNQANYVRFRDAKNRKDRIKVMRTFWKHHTRFKNTHAILIDGEVKNHFFKAKIRHYKNCLESALFPHNIHPKVYHTLVETVKENTGPLHRFLKLKARLLNLKKLTYDDIYTSSVPAVEKQYTIDEAKGIVIAALRPLGKEYTDILEKGFGNRWADIYPNQGKRSGAYCNGSVYDEHPFVLMNYNGTYNHISTLGHEFGHALHSWFSNKTKPFPLAHYPIFLAEIASTFNETLLVHYLLETETDDLVKLYILDQYLEEFRGTLYRQTLFADFELIMHQWVEKGQTLTPDWLDNTYLTLTRQYYGHKRGIISVNKYIKNEWSNVPHFYYNFYVYQYSTGIAAATALADMVLKGSKVERTRYLDFLKSGGSKYPLDTLKDAGVDLTSPQPIVMAVRKFDEIVNRMEIIVKRLEDKGVLSYFHADIRESVP
jgi:oligoendopeptidase F